MLKSRSVIGLLTENGVKYLEDQVMASAALDRILHDCTVVNIRGESYGLKDKKRMSNINMAEVK